MRCVRAEDITKSEVEPIRARWLLSSAMGALSAITENWIKASPRRALRFAENMTRKRRRVKIQSSKSSEIELEARWKGTDQIWRF